MSPFLKTFAKDWPFAVLFLLPLLPQIGYLPLAIPVVGILAMILAFRGRKREFLDGNGLQLGAALLGVTVLLSATKIVWERDFSGLTYGTSVLLAICSLLLALSQSGRKDQSVPKIALGMLLLWTIWVAFHAVGESFEALNIQLTYEKGFGNVSQIAMYAGFAGLCWAAQGAKNKWEGPAVSMAMAVLAWWLDSKLLWGLLLLLLLSTLLRNQRLSLRRSIALAIGFTVLIGVWLLQPGALQGRMDALQIAVEGQSQFQLLGSGLGGLEPFLNGLFYRGEAINTVGEIGPYAFNDYLQAWIELGPLGLLALLLLSVSVVLGPKPLLGLGWIGVSAIMFPLQYIESAVLWTLTAALLARKSSFFPRGGKIFYQTGFFFSTAALVVFFFLGSRFHRLYEADQLCLSGDKAGCLADYNLLTSEWSWNSQFHLKYATKLQSSGKLSESLAEYRIAAALNPSYTVLTHLADACFDTQLYQEALLRYQQAEMLRPARLFPGYRQVFCLLALNRRSEARDLATLLCAKFGNSGQGLQAAMLTELRKVVQN